MVEAVTAALLAAQAERSAVMRENDTLRREVADMCESLQQLADGAEATQQQNENLCAEVAALRAALVAAAGDDVAKADALLTRAGGESEGTVGAAASNDDATRVLGGHVAGEGVDEEGGVNREADEVSAQMTESSKTKKATRTTGMTRPPPSPLQFETTSAQRDFARGVLSSAEETLSEVKLRTAEVDAMQNQLHVLQTELYQPATPGQTP